MAAAADYRQLERGTARVLKVKGTSSYQTGGYDLPAAMISSPSGALLGLNDGGTQIALVSGTKVKFMVSATGAEVANATDMSAVTVSVLVP